MSDGRSAAWPFEDSGQGKCAKKMTSTSLTTLCESIAMTVGKASRKIVAYRLPVGRTCVARSGVIYRASLTRGGVDPQGGRPARTARRMPEGTRLFVCDRGFSAAGFTEA